MLEMLYIFVLGVAIGGFLTTLRNKHAVAEDTVEVLYPKKEKKLFRPAAGVVARQKEKKEANKHAILGAFAWAAGGRVQIKDIEKMLGVSESTAVRYMDELERENKVQKGIGPDQKVYYEKLS